MQRIPHLGLVHYYKLVQRKVVTGALGALHTYTRRCEKEDRCHQQWTPWYAFGGRRSEKPESTSVYKPLDFRFWCLETDPTALNKVKIQLGDDPQWLQVGHKWSFVFSLYPKYSFTFEEQQPKSLELISTEYERAEETNNEAEDTDTVTTADSSISDRSTSETLSDFANELMDVFDPERSPPL